MDTDPIGIQPASGSANDPGKTKPVVKPTASKPAPASGGGIGIGGGTQQPADSRGANPDHQGPARTGKRKPAASGKAESKTPQAQIDVEAPEIVLTGDAEAPKGKAKARPKKAPKIDGKAAAAGLLEMVEVFTVSLFGYDAAFSPTEKFMIEDPLARVIEKYGAAVGKYSGLIDPIMLLTGLGMYAVRLDTLHQERQRQAQAQAEAQARAQRQAQDMPYDPTMQPQYPPAESPANPNANGSAATANLPPEMGALFGSIHRDR